MTVSNAHILHPPVAPLAAYLRVGHTGHQKLEALHAANRLAFRRMVFDAAYVHSPQDLLKLPRGAGFKIVLDLNVAETAAAGRFGSAVCKLPWGNPDRPRERSDFGPQRNGALHEADAGAVVHSRAPVFRGGSGRNGGGAATMGRTP